ncbi:3-dehydroquinate synthase [Alkalihalobacterium chitinilyticum]|uniref:3-dehydroquinate synthase n=1 Tax=Alkalihalobacterium chitinilyticum TaxID=2980103 RepID=A0ABT5V8X2_9BACI|nr:3-dehydroquinate synthase [Alkalihalobacterium chitinilyticum]MDE5411923.1 3-dehydroquinate synthase [Alkalihalobacterium chitinilyticum]
MEQLHINTSSKQYSVWIGDDIRYKVSEYIPTPLQQKVSSVLIITDDQVAPLYLQDVKNGLSNRFEVFEYIVPAGEQSKSFQQYYDIQTYALEQGLDRHSLVIALGGGVIGDLAGFVAATYMRGVPFIQVPTTLLAHDSSVGGKVGINHPLGKNMIGAFHQPEAVVYDPTVFKSLPLHEWRSGFAEAIKHSLIWDAQLYSWLQDHIDDFSNIKGELAEQLLLRSIAVKAAVVSEDEKENGIRAILNFGHTLGHAIEKELGYGKMTHGEAVAVGMIFAMRLSEQYYDISLPIDEVKAWLTKLGYETDIPVELDPNQLVHTMKKDKKAQKGVIRMVLMKELGRVEVVSVDEEPIKELLLKSIKGE